MPKRVLDFEALWASDKIAACAEWSQAEYAWLYGLADANGSFEISNLRVTWGKVAAVRKNLSLERLEQIVDEFHHKGLLFIWTENGKRYGHWTGSDKPGRLPRESRRTPRYGPIFAPPVSKKELSAYATECASRCDSKTVAPSDRRGNPEYQSVDCDSKPVEGLGLGLGRVREKTSLSEAKGASDLVTTASPAQSPRKPKIPPSDAGLRLALKLQDRIRANNPNSKTTEATVSSWAHEADLMMRRDGRTEQQIADLIDWSQQDSFWSSVILSMAKLREKFDQLTLKKKGGSNGNSNGRHNAVDPNEQTRRRFAAAGLAHT